MKFKIYISALSVLVGLGVVTGITEYVRIKHKQTQSAKQYTSLMKNAETDIKKMQWSAGIQSLDRAIAIEKSSTTARKLKNAILSVQGHYIGVNGISVIHIPPGSIKNSPGYGVYVKSVVPNSPAQQASLQSGDILLSGSDIATNVNNIASGFNDMFDLEALIDKTPIGGEIFIQVQKPSGKKKVVHLKVETVPSGMNWTVGYYTQGRFGDSFQLPTLSSNGMPFGWQPVSSAGGDGSGRIFQDPLDTNISIDIYGMNNSTNQSMTSLVPPAATVVNRSLNLMGYPAIMYKQDINQNGVDIVEEGIVVGSPYLASMNGIDVSVPKDKISKWQPLINDILNSFVPGNLSQTN